MAGAGESRVFVAGATGVIGRVLCPMLIAEGWRVVGTTRRADQVAPLAAQEIDPVVVDVFDADRLRAAVVRARPRALVHLVTDLPDRWDPALRDAALRRTARVREAGTRNLVDAAVAAGVEVMVAQSIAFVYAPGPWPHEETDPLDVDATDPGTALTARAVRVLEDLVCGGPFRGVVLRFGLLYGPGTWTSAPSPGGPVHVDAAADAACRALRLDAAGIYNVAEPDGTVSVTKAMRELGWRPGVRFTSQRGTS